MKDLTRGGRRTTQVMKMRDARVDPEGIELATLDRLISLAGKRVLEIGCGDGRLTRPFAERARSVVAIDPDRQDIASARRALPARLKGRVAFEVAAGESLPFSDGEFEVAVFSWSL